MKTDNKMFKNITRPMRQTYSLELLNDKNLIVET